MLKSYRPDRAKVGSLQGRPGFGHMAAFVEFMVQFWRECASFHSGTRVSHCHSFTVVQASNFSESTSNSAAQEMLRRLRKPKVRNRVNERHAPRLIHSQPNSVHAIHINIIPLLLKQSHTHWWLMEHPLNQPHKRRCSFWKKELFRESTLPLNSDRSIKTDDLSCILRISQVNELVQLIVNTLQPNTDDGCIKCIKDQQMHFNWNDILLLYYGHQTCFGLSYGHLQGGLLENKKISVITSKMFITPQY